MQLIYYLLLLQYLNFKLFVKYGGRMLNFLGFVPNNFLLNL